MTTDKERLLEAAMREVHPSVILKTLRGACDLLTEASALFRDYEASHRAKVESLTWKSTTLGAEAVAKADRNAEIAQRIESFLAGGDS